MSVLLCRESSIGKYARALTGNERVYDKPPAVKLDLLSFDVSMSIHLLVVLSKFQITRTLVLSNFVTLLSRNVSIH